MQFVMNKKSLSLLFFLTLFFGFSYAIQIHHNSQFKNIKYLIFKNNDNTFGYDIISSGKKIIHQPNIPCIESNVGFSSRLKAEAIAKIVVKKMTLGEFPPTLKINEILKQIN
jgi:hypothetical protein